jgi:hypothetical protein
MKTPLPKFDDYPYIPHTQTKDARDSGDLGFP